MLLEYLYNPPNSLGIPRSQMPQIRKEDIPDFLNQLKREGVSVSFQKFPVSRLKPTQSEINMNKVDSKSDILQKGTKPFLVSKDFRILDGHHQLYAILQQDSNYKVECWLIGLSMQELLMFAKRYNKVGYKEIHEQKKKKKKLMNFKDLRKKLRMEAVGAEPDVETETDKLRDKQDREKEELQKKQEDEMIDAREKDMRDSIEKQRRDREAKRAEKSVKEAHFVGTPEALQHALDYVPGSRIEVVPDPEEKENVKFPIVLSQNIDI